MEVPPEVIGDVIVQCTELYTSRLVEYFAEWSDLCQVVASDNCLIFIRPNSTQQFLDKCFAHPFLYRYTHRYYVVQIQTPDLDFKALGSLNDKIWRMQAFPRATEPVIYNSIRPEDGVQSAFPNLQNSELNFHPKNFTHYLSVVHSKGLYYIGVAPKKYYFSEDNAVHSVQKNKVSRAYHKIKEAIERTGIVPIEKNWICVDVGAAPGGWSLYLSERAQKVIAVDAAEVTVVKHLPNVVHLQMLSQKAAPEITESIDLLTCDVNHAPEVALEAISPIVPMLKNNGFILLTLKMPKRAQKNIQRRVDLFCKQFTSKYPEFKILKNLWLLANLNERCFIAQKNVDKAQ